VKSIARKLPILDVKGEKEREFGNRKEWTLAISLDEIKTVFAKIEDYSP